MLKSIILIILKLSPSSKKWFWEKWYNVFARNAKNTNLKLMNYGYHSPSLELKLNEEDEIERYPIQLYSFIANQAEIIDKNILEIGSGRGGGASWIAKSLHPSSLIGVDFSSEAVSLCHNWYNHQKNLRFIEGNAENLPFKNSSFDVVYNVESSHCYGNMSKFVEEVFRVLREGGSFYWTDFRDDKSMQSTNQIFLDLSLIHI